VIKKSSQDLEEIVSDKDTVALGPSVTNKEKTKAVNGQDEVDSLLEDLGI
jgi:chemotaxis regulatin CheY-phosphate phosphatase CheZ